MRVGRVVAAVVGGSVLSLTACSDDGGPTVLPTGPTATSETTSVTESTSPTSTAEHTPSTTVTLPPSQAPEVDAFVREFFDAYNAAQDSGDFSEFDALYLPQCEGCVTMRDELQGWLSDGGAVEGADWVILQQSTFRQASDFVALAVGYRKSGGAGVDEIPQSRATQFTVVVRGEPGFLLTGLSIGDA